jgi:arylsulfatase A-like enzyme
MLPTLLGDANQRQHDYLYWEYQGKQAVRLGAWKAYRASVESEIELYDLESDIAEQRDVAAAHPEIVARIAEIMRTGRSESELFPLVPAQRRKSE